VTIVPAITHRKCGTSQRANHEPAGRNGRWYSAQWLKMYAERVAEVRSFERLGRSAYVV